MTAVFSGERGREQIENEVQSGEFLPGVKAETLRAFVLAFSYGYALFREPFAREMNVDLAQLDEEVTALYSTLLESIMTAKTPTKRARNEETKGHLRHV